MAGDWLKFEKATLDKPEVFALADALGLDPDAVVGKLMRIWSWFDTHTIDGSGRGVTPPLLDRISGASGFVDAMAGVGWLEVTPQGVRLVNFDRHTGESAKARALTARRVARHKGRSNASIVTPPLTREEQRRGEKNSSYVDTPTPPDGSTSAHTGVVVGAFEGDPEEAARFSRSRTSPTALAATALRHAGVHVTSQNPDLIAFIDEGGTLEHLLELTAQYPGKPVKYLTSTARRELTERAAAIPAPGAAPAMRNAGPSRQAQAIARVRERFCNEESTDATDPTGPRLVSSDRG